MPSLDTLRRLQYAEPINFAHVAQLTNSTAAINLIIGGQGPGTRLVVTGICINIISTTTTDCALLLAGSNQVGILVASATAPVGMFTMAGDALFVAGDNVSVALQIPADANRTRSCAWIAAKVVAV